VLQLWQRAWNFILMLVLRRQSLVLCRVSPQCWQCSRMDKRTSLVKLGVVSSDRPVLPLSGRGTSSIPILEVVGSAWMFAASVDAVPPSGE
jgi:hypothetical protein